MENNEIQNQNQQSEQSPLMKWILRCLGLVLMALSVTGATGQTFFGAFLTYSLSFVFGIFYPAVLIILFSIGVILFVRAKLFTFHNHTFLIFGLVVLCLSLLAFASYPICVEDDVSLLSLNSVYLSRIKSFSSHPFVQIDDYSMFSALGGGYLGLLFVSLLGTVWGNVGNVIFFTLLLLLSVFLLAYKPCQAIFQSYRKAKESKISYDSKYKKEKENTNFLNRNETAPVPVEEKTEVKNEVYSPFTSFRPYQPQSEPVQEDKTITPAKSAPVTTGFSNDQLTPSGGTSYVGTESPFTSYKAPEQQTTQQNVFTQPVYQQQPVQPSYQSQQPAQQTTQPASQQSAFTQPIYQQQPVQPSYQSQPSVQPAAQPASQQGAFSQPVYQQQPVQPSYQPQQSVQQTAQQNVFTQPATPSSYQPQQSEQPRSAFLSTASAVTTEAAEEPLPQPQPSVYPSQQPSEPVLSAPVQPQSIYQQPQPVQPQPQYPTPSQPVQQSKQIFFKMEEEPAEEEQQHQPAPVVPEKELKEPTQEEKEAALEKQYFENKRKKLSEQIMERRRAKEEKQRALLRYVSERPKIYNYVLPNDSMLTERDDSAKIVKNSDVALEKAKVINETFKEFGFKGKVTGYTIGMSVTRFDVETDYGEKVDKLNGLTTELQRSLQGDQSVRVETVVEGSSHAGIEVGNKFPMAVSFKDVFMSIETNTKDNLLLPIGKEVGGSIISFPLNKMPHLLVAGTTGSGKSVLVHSMIMTLIMRNYPSQLKLLLVDPKQVEFVRYQDCAHLLCPVISKPESAVMALKKLCDEMDHRFTLLSKAKVSNMEEYAKYCDDHPEEQRLYSIVCIIDEFADLMQTAGPEVTKCVTRIAQKARAAGIYLIIATQRPSKDNVPMIIKANVPSRIGLSCSSAVDSRVILDEGGAETLLGKGDLLFKCPGKKNLIRAQSPFVSDDEINKVLEYIHFNAGEPCYHRDFIDLDSDEDDSVEELGKNDPETNLYNDIKDFILQTRITNKANIMRNFQITNQKCEQIFNRMLSENFLMLGYGGYELGPAAITTEVYR